MSLSDTFDMDRICDRLRYALLYKNISVSQAAKELRVSRDLIFDYINYKCPEDSMQVKYLIKFAEYFGEDKYYFCNEYHRFLDSVDMEKLLRGLRTEHNMTQKEFAGYLGISLSRYKAYEQGRCKASKEMFDILKNNTSLKF